MRKAINQESDQSSRYASYRAFDEGKFYILKVYEIIKRLNQKYNFKKALDVGCADGSFAAKLKKDFGFDCYGIDISEGAIKLACDSGIKATQHNLEKPLSYPDNFFDLISACETIEHIYDTDFFISELARVLKPKGILILTTPNLVSLVNRVKILLGAYPAFVPEYRIGKEEAGHIRAYTIPVLQRQLSEHGLRIVVKSSPNITFPMDNKFVPKPLKKAAIRLGDVFPTIGSHMIVAAEK